MIITVTINPALDKTINVGRLTINGVNRVESVRLDAGGKGINVSKVVKILGGDTVAMGILGGESGLYIQHTLSDMGINCKFCYVDSPTRTNIKIVDVSMHTSTELNERGEPVTLRMLDQLFDYLCEKVRPGDTVVFAGANPPGTPDSLLAFWTRAMIERGASVCIDTKGKHLLDALRYGPALVTPNKEELEELCDRRLYFDVDVISEAKALVAQGAQRVVVTLGAEGAVFVTEDQVIRAYCGKVPVVCATGAGDTLLAALALCLEKGMPWKECIRYSVAASVAHVMHPGTECGTPEEVEQMLPIVRIDELM